MAKSNSKTGSLKSGRPPLSTSAVLKAASTAGGKKSSKTTRTLIRSHHNLHKQRAKAVSQGNHTLTAEFDAQIAQLGGLEAYQAASLTGQSKDRGGDSSILLVSWLQQAGLVGNPPTVPGSHRGLRVLEIGSLSSKNAISSLTGKGIATVKRIDLKSQEPGQIEEIDFMRLPVPDTDGDKFDLISLSLVLNYVPDAHGRGQMLRRTRLFLKHDRPKEFATRLPALFLVLPLPCVVNSRYLTADRLRELMASLGYHSTRTHQSAKLHYELFHHHRHNHVGTPSPSSSQPNAPFRKLEVNPGKGRNNFSITTD